MVQPEANKSKLEKMPIGNDGDLPQNQTTKIPEYGLKLNLNHTYPEDRSQSYVPSLKQIWVMLPLIVRYLIYYVKYKLLGKSIVMDFIKVTTAKRIYGVPIGGIGCGTIGRGYRGEFCRFQLKPGIYEYNTVDANQFIVTIKNRKQETILQSVLSTFPRKKLSSWQNCIDGDHCFYTGLYPRSWTEYDLSEYGVNLVCRQISPVIPNNYKDSSFPCAVFVWDIINVCDEDRTVTISFTFKNGTGNAKQDRDSTCSSKSFSYSDTEGVILYHTINKMPCAYALSIKSQPTVAITKCLYFDPNSNGSTVWNQLKQNGGFDKTSDKHYGHRFGEMACGISGKTTIPSKRQTTIEMSLVWDMPTITFPSSPKKHNRFYTKYTGTDNAVLKIVDYAFKNYQQWEDEIYNWQNNVLSDSRIPDWYKSALFNESYYISDGGSIWLTLDDDELSKLPLNDPRRNYGRFAYLEGHEYRMCNTYDVHFYASFCLIMNWPCLQLCLQYDMKDAIFTEIPTKVTMLYDGQTVERKYPNTVPHDLGDPGEEPFNLPNSYPIHDVSEWRDLNVKFILQVYRDAELIKNKLDSKQYLTDMYDACCAVMESTAKFDIDDDGLIENSGAPDQTFDTWIMQGSSAYCGGLWLAALYMMTKIANVLNKPNDAKKYEQTLNKAIEAYEQKLWNGRYYNFDCSRDECSSIMADQLCGQWYLRCCGFSYEVFKKDRVLSSLKTIYENNVLLFSNGKLGAVNGIIDGKIDPFTIQSLEVWTGVTYALAAHMLFENMLEEGWQTAGGLFESMTERMGLAFQTPEALCETKFYRSVGYMRPLSIWSMQLAVQQNKNNDNQKL